MRLLWILIKLKLSLKTQKNLIFNKRTHCALVLMIELAHIYGKESVEIFGIAIKHNLSVHAFDGIVEALDVSGYITLLNGQLSLQIAPDKVSI